MVIAVFPVILMVVGLALWVWGSHGKPPRPLIAEAGRILFFCGTLALALSMTKTVVKIGQSQNDAQQLA